jgi:Protein of unknown function (DUF1257)
MSHFTSIKTEVRDLDALALACVELDLKLQPDVPCRGYAGVHRKAERTISLRGPYDIAVDPSPEKDGTYALTTDWWDGHVAKEVGVGYGRLLQAYGIHKTFREAHARGLRATRRLEADGSVLVTLEGGAL